MADLLSASKDQQHPQWQSDRQVVNKLMVEDPTDFNLAELARLTVRYQGFPGGRDIQADLETLFKKWQLTPETLFAKTREIHGRAPIYTVRSNKREDWN
ncbi:MAG: DUF3288 family protein [Thermosynechococcaceae cyanobacterium MS004]|nr:DUF3288 family protein [Thermosynechococcaceae cyanobacterium MS004]